eukprot:TRINITY_DN779_c1_g2_i1.p2 TRINITY_DN779_c1_g2~~TRINITY_DN779_c1_g2_i1.p2  ORF type:complete len:269 (-),score=31.44 TRINITY_DN779_c1_g2_i1:92-814(-)
MLSELERLSLNPLLKNYQFLFGDMASNSDTTKFFGISENKFPAYVIYDVSNDVKYIQQNTNTEDLEQFIRDYQDEKLTPFVKSEPVPGENDDKIPKKVVADNFNQVVFNNNKDVLLEFTAPWCKDCKRLVSTYKKIALYYENNTDTDVFVAVMNVEVNDIPNDRLKQFESIPTILYIRQKDKTICQLEQNMSTITFEQITQFVDDPGGNNCFQQDMSQEKQQLQEQEQIKQTKQERKEEL